MTPDGMLDPVADLDVGYMVRVRRMRFSKNNTGKLLLFFYAAISVNLILNYTTRWYTRNILRWEFPEILHSPISSQSECQCFYSSRHEACKSYSISSKPYFPKQLS